MVVRSDKTKVTPTNVHFMPIPTIKCSSNTTTTHNIVEPSIRKINTMPPTTSNWKKAL
jgi:hypothetical protein